METASFPAAASRMPRYMPPRSSALRRAMQASVLATTLATSAWADMLKPGASMPSFALPDQDGVMVKSSDLAGKSYLLWFYPKAMTYGCTNEAIALRDHYKSFEASGVVVLGVSFDEPATNKQFAQTEALPFRLLSDKDRTLSVAVGAAKSTSDWWASRISYLVGPDGKVVKAYEDVAPSEHAEQVISDLPAKK